VKLEGTERGVQRLSRLPDRERPLAKVELASFHSIDRDSSDVHMREELFFEKYMLMQLTRNGDAIHLNLKIGSMVRLMMVPLLVVGAYLFFTLVMSVGEVVSGVSTESEALPGQFFCLMFGVGCGLPGLLGLLIKSSVVINMERGTVSRVYNFRLFKRSIEEKLSIVQRITVSRETAGDGALLFGGTGAELFNVNLVPSKRGKVILAAVVRTRSEALELAEELAMAIQVPFEDLADTNPVRD
jgi:hypothetical protein